VCRPELEVYITYLPMPAGSSRCMGTVISGIICYFIRMSAVCVCVHTVNEKRLERSIIHSGSCLSVRSAIRPVIKLKRRVFRCLAHIRELLDILHSNHATITAREPIADETDGDKFAKVFVSYVL